MTPPVLVYLGMGLLVARIMLDGTRTRGFTWLQWFQFLVDAARIVFLWPLVLFIEKLETWLKSSEAESAYPVALFQNQPSSAELEKVEQVEGDKP
jgi:hypothetical protein